MHSRKLKAAAAAALGVVVLAASALASAGPADRPGKARASTATVKITLKEFKLIPSPSGTTSRTVTFAIKNSGKLEHEFIVLRTSKRAGNLPLSGGKAKEIGELAEAEDIGPGKTRHLTVKFKAGHYALICNVKGHYKAGQFADFNVR